MDENYHADGEGQCKTLYGMLQCIQSAKHMESLPSGYSLQILRRVGKRVHSVNNVRLQKVS